MGRPFDVDVHLRKGLGSILSHRDKYNLFADIGTELASHLEDDHAELEAKGFSHSTRGRQLAALFEALVAEQYSVLGGLRTAAYSIYRGVAAIQNESTYKFFSRARTGKYGSASPGRR